LKRSLLKKYLLIFLGSLSLALGVAGVLIPILPTTPFLLLASFCYLRSSSRMHNWLFKHKIFGSYIYSYLKYKAISKKTKIYSIIFLWASLLISILLIPSLHFKIILFLVGLGVTIHFMTLKTMSGNELETLN
jgi:uncharacterized membrane protein YbaN (DUF454 family)